MEIFKDFGVNPILLLAQVVNFIILLYILKRFLYKPILKVLEERKERIETSMKQAEEIQRKIDKTTSEQEKILNQARAQASKIIDQTKDEAKSVQEQMFAEAQRTSAETIRRTQETIVLEQQKMVDEAKKQIINLVVAATEKVTAKTIKKQDQEQLIKDAIKEIRQ